MAIYHLRAKIMSRGKGQSAVAGAAYRQGGYSVVAMAGYRSGSVLTDERTGRSWDYTRKHGVEHTEILAPDGAPAWAHDRALLWNRVEASEKRKDAQLAREIEISLPRELSPEQCRDLVRDFVQREFVARGMIADICIHRPQASDGGEQPHAHVMLTMRSIGPEGFGAKVRDWNRVELLEHWRSAWAEAANAALESAGEAARIDHRTLAAQSTPREAQPYLPSILIWERVRGISEHLRERFDQWVGIRHRNRVREQVQAARQGEPPQSFAARIVARLVDYGRALGMPLGGPNDRDLAWEIDHEP